MSEAILPLFWELASLEDSSRFAATAKLISSLESSQEDGKEKDLSSDLQYSVKRLVKGLSSPRQGARQGFTEALCELLRRFPIVSSELVIDLAKQHLQTGANMKGYEESNALVGQVVMVVALFRSGRLTGKKVKEETLSFAVDQLLSCRGRKSYLTEICSTVLGDIAASMSSPAFMKHLMPLLKSELEVGWENCTPDQLMVVLKVFEHHAGALGDKHWMSHWQCSNILAEENTQRLIDVLLKAGSIHSAKVHGAWILLSQAFLPDASKFEAFWRASVENTLLASTHDRRFAALQLAEAVLPLASLQQLPVILSATLLKFVVKCLASKKSYLHAAAKHFCESLVLNFKTLAEADPTAAATTADASSERQIEGLVDVLLDLLWHPSRDLRAAVDQIFRGLVRHLNSASLDLLVTAVAGQDKEDEGGDNEEEMLTDDDDEGESDDEDSDDDDDDDDEVSDVGSDDESDIADAAEGSDVGSGDEAGDDSDEGLPDEDMPEDPEEIARVDAALAAEFKHRIGLKKQRRLERLNLTHFRLRALDIMEIVVRRSHRAVFLLRLVLPLMEVTLEKASDGQAKALTERAQGLLKSRLCKSRPDSLSTGEEVEEGYVVLQQLFEFAGHASNASVSANCMQAIMFTLRVMHISSSTSASGAAAPSSATAEPSRIVEIFSTPLEEFITKKGSRLSSSLFTELVGRYPAVAWLLARTMAKHLPSSANDFRRKEICTMLCTLLSRKDSSLYAPLHFFGLAKVLRRSLPATLKQAIEQSDKVKAKNFRQLTSLIQHFLRLSSQSNEKLGKNSCEELGTTLASAAECNLASRSPEIKAMLTKLLAQCKEVCN